MSNVTNSRVSWGADYLVTQNRNVERANGVAVFAVLAFVLALLAIFVTVAPRNAPTGADSDVSTMFGP